MINAAQHTMSLILETDLMSFQRYVERDIEYSVDEDIHQQVT